MTKFRQRVLLEHVRCPECGVPMMDRVGQRGKFYGCSRFPLCIGTRPQGGTEPDSYTKLLREAYNKALITLSSPKYMGFRDAGDWLRTQALGRELSEEEEENFTLSDLANECLERGIDAACAWCSEKSGEFIDFLLNAHEARYAATRGKLKYMTSSEQIKRMPKAEIMRRYDTSDLSQFEGHISDHWDSDGCVCPRCEAWSEPKVKEKTVTVFSMPMTDEEMKALFNDEEPSTVERHWMCGRCGEFKRTEVYADKQVTSVSFEFMEDKNDPLMVPGAGFRAPSS